MTTTPAQRAANLVAVDTDRDWGLFVGGRPVPSRSGAMYGNVSPATETRIATVPNGSAADVDDARSIVDDATRPQLAAAGNVGGELVNWTAMLWAIGNRCAIGRKPTLLELQPKFGRGFGFWSVS